MDKTTLQQWQEVNALVVDAVHAALDETQRAHTQIAGYPYAVLRKIAPIAGPVRAIEWVQTTITTAVYGSLRAMTGVAGAVSTFALDEVARRQTGDER